MSLLGTAAGARVGGEPLEGSTVAGRATLVLADGEGSYGAAAARAATAALFAAVEEDAVKLEGAFAAAHDAVLGASVSAVAGVVDAALTLHLAHVGSARAYLLRHGAHALPAPPAPKLTPPVEVASGDPKRPQLRCLTRDHTAIAERVESGEAAAAEARSAPRGELARALGRESAPSPDVVRLPLQPGDVVLLATEAVWRAIEDAPLGELMAKKASAEATLAAVLDAASAAGATGDLGAAVLVVAEPAASSASPSPPLGGSVLPSPPVASPGGSRLDGPLARYGRDLCQLARDGKLDPVIGRRREMRALAEAIVSRKKPNALLIGPAGVGKTSIVEGLARMLAEGDAPKVLDGKTLVEVSVTSMLAGTRLRGEFEERMEALIKAAERDSNVVLFFDELHVLMGAGGPGGGSGDASQILKPALARGSLRVIGATTTAEYQRFIADDPAFERRFTLVDVEEPSEDEATAILEGLKDKLEAHYEVTIEPEALRAAVRLSARYVVDRHLPDKAIELVDRACARLLVDGADPMTLAPRHVVQLVAERCDVDPELVSAELSTVGERVAGLEQFLRARVFGQDDAMTRVARELERAYSGFKDPDRPIATMIFVGPSGVGKTETAKLLAEFLFGDRDRVLRIDLSEYSERHTVSRLVGSPPGYVGHDAEGQLTGPMHLLPQRVVLLDEIEKAHPDVLNVLLQLLDEGRLTDARGKVASYREAVIVLTSNLIKEVPKAKRAIGFGAPDPKDAPSGEEDVLRSTLSRHLAPELVGRIGLVALFTPLDATAARAIASTTANRMARRLRAQGTPIEVPADLVDKVVARLGSLDLGARGVERLVSDELGRALDAPAELVASGTLDDRQKLAILTVARLREDAPALEELAMRARTANSGSELRAVTIREGRLTVVTTTVKGALALATELTADRDDLRGVIHRARVKGLDDGRPRGPAVELGDVVLEMLGEGAGPRVALTGSAVEALEGGLRSLRPLHAEGAEDLAIELWKLAE